MLKTLRLILIIFTIILSVYLWGLFEEASLKEVFLPSAVIFVIRLKEKSRKINRSEKKKRAFYLVGIIKIKELLNFFLKARWYQGAFFEG